MKILSFCLCYFIFTNSVTPSLADSLFHSVCLSVCLSVFVIYIYIYIWQKKELKRDSMRIIIFIEFEGRSYGVRFKGPTLGSYGRLWVLITIKSNSLLSSLLIKSISQDMQVTTFVDQSYNWSKCDSLDHTNVRRHLSWDTCLLVY